MALYAGNNHSVSKIKVLVVEDFEPFRRCICSTLYERPELQVIGEVSDGMEAVRKAEQLQPNLILLDVGLPTLNGIDAARLIRTLSPESKIIFMSLERSADVVQEAMSLGAWGYVVKTKATNDLLAAVRAVCDGKRFVSEGLAAQPFTERDPPVANGPKQPLRHYSAVPATDLPEA